MKGLVIKSPYIEDILTGKKTWEVRCMNTKTRGTIVLLKSGSGLALGTVDIIDVKILTLDDYNNWDYRRGLNKVFDLPYSNTYAYILENPKYFDKPIKYIHPMGAITWVKLPDDFIEIR